MVQDIFYYCRPPKFTSKNPVGVDNFYKLSEGGFEVIQVVINIRVVKFDSRENSGQGAVMQKLWSLVKKRRVVFIALGDKIVADRAL